MTDLQYRELSRIGHRDYRFTNTNDRKEKSIDPELRWSWIGVLGLQRTTHTTTLNQFMFTSLDLKLMFKSSDNLSPTDNDAKFNIKKQKTQDLNCTNLWGHSKWRWETKIKRESKQRHFPKRCAKHFCSQILF